jgi:ATP-binding cassette subfamily B protein
MLVQQVQNLQEIGANVERVNELFSISTRIKDPVGSGVPPASGPATAEFREVTFGYNPDEPVIRNVTFSVRPGSVLGLLGRTGSGKSTLARLIFRLYDPQAGVVTLDGTKVQSYRLEHLRSRVAMVTQDVQIFQASVRDNLTFFDDTVPDDQLHEVIDELGLSQWFSRLPDGLDSRIEQGGKGLSAGEAQLLAFTRVFLRDPGLIILDEASSRLDPATETLIERVVDRLLTDRSAIIIAHRLATVARADDILVMEGGESVEFGNRERLARDTDSRFYGLLRTGLEDVLA